MTEQKEAMREAVKQAIAESQKAQTLIRYIKELETVSALFDEDSIEYNHTRRSSYHLSFALSYVLCEHFKNNPDKNLAASL